MTLGDFVKQLAVRLQDEHVVMPFKDDRPWHMLFYRLHKEASPQSPDFLQYLEFDWDGPYPRSQDLSDFLQGLHWTGSVSALNPSYERILVPEAVVKAWRAEGENLGAENDILLSRGLEIAKKEFVSTLAA